MARTARQGEPTMKRAARPPRGQTPMPATRQGQWTETLADERSPEPRQVGVCRYAGADVAYGAEISVAVADDWQHRGLGRLLLRRLIDYARAWGTAALFHGLDLQ